MAVEPVFWTNPALHGDQACRGEQTHEDDPEADVQRAERRRIDKSINRLKGQHKSGASKERSLREARYSLALAVSESMIAIRRPLSVAHSKVGNHARRSIDECVHCRCQQCDGTSRQPGGELQHNEDYRSREADAAGQLPQPGTGSALFLHIEHRQSAAPR